MAGIRRCRLLPRTARRVERTRRDEPAPLRRLPATGGGPNRGGPAQLRRERGAGAHGPDRWRCGLGGAGSRPRCSVLRLPGRPPPPQPHRPLRSTRREWSRRSRGPHAEAPRSAGGLSTPGRPPPRGRGRGPGHSPAGGRAVGRRRGDGPPRRIAPCLSQLWRPFPHPPRIRLPPRAPPAGRSLRRRIPRYRPGGDPGAPRASPESPGGGGAARDPDGRARTGARARVHREPRASLRPRKPEGGPRRSARPLRGEGPHRSRRACERLLRMSRAVLLRASRLRTRAAGPGIGVGERRHRARGPPPFQRSAVRGARGVESGPHERLPVRPGAVSGRGDPVVAGPQPSNTGNPVRSQRRALLRDPRHGPALRGRGLQRTRRGELPGGGHPAGLPGTRRARRRGPVVVQPGPPSRRGPGDRGGSLDREGGGALPESRAPGLGPGPHARSRDPHLRRPIRNRGGVATGHHLRLRRVSTRASPSHGP